MSAPAPSRLWALDVLRGLCATVVFLSHWYVWSNFSPSGQAQVFVHSFLGNCYDTITLFTWPTGGNHPAVIAFFILSGFCIHGPVERRFREQNLLPDWKLYFKRRFFRIAPVYWVSSLLGLFFIALYRWHPTGDELLSLHASGTYRHMAVRLFGLAGVFPQEVIAGNYLLNTVSSEIIMYAVYPLLFLVALRKGGWFFLGILFVGLQVGSLSLLSTFSPYWVFNSVAMMGVFWYLGALCAHLFFVRNWRIPLAGVIGVWSLFLLLKAMPHFYGLNMAKQAAWGLSCALFIMWALDFELHHEQLGKSALIRFMRFLADISYSLYAVHTPVIMMVSWMLIAVFGCRDYFAQLTTTLLLSTAATLLLHYFVEKRFHTTSPR
jgi:peptidoglycan/LPS O-acetylase OafA/YrhL